MRRVLLLLLLGLPFCRSSTAAEPTAAPAPAAGFTRSLGGNLVYHRASTLPAGLPATESQPKRPLVLDLRYARGDAAGGVALTAWLRFYATARSPVFVLANGATDRAILRALAERGNPAGIVTLGVPAEDFVPDIAVETTAENEQRAYAALQSGADVATLIMENADKARNDEASLAHARPTDLNSEAPKERATPPALVDAALQRAVHLHHALVALKKL